MGSGQNRYCALLPSCALFICAQTLQQQTVVEGTPPQTTRLGAFEPTSWRSWALSQTMTWRAVTWREGQVWWWTGQTTITWAACLRPARLLGTLPLRRLSELA